ncbi:hypothetical protein ACA910_008074 [Epithemia clementina (nom. ined.)]
MKGLQVAPFGFVCEFCGEGISESLRLMHRHMRLHKECVTKEGYAESLQKICTLQQDIQRDWSLLSAYLFGTTRKGFSCDCIIGFLHWHVAQQHVDTGHCEATLVVEEELHDAVGGYVVSLRALKLHVNGSNKHTGLRVKQPTTAVANTTKAETVRPASDDSEMIVPFLREDESSWLNVYYSMIHGYMSTNVSGNNFKDTMVQSILQWSQPIQTSDKKYFKLRLYVPSGLKTMHA